MKRILLTSAFALIASAANAADVYSGGSLKDTPSYSVPVAPTWTGFVVGLDVNGQFINHELKLNEANVNLLDLDGLSGTGTGGGVLVEYRHQFGPRFVFGIGAEYDFISAPFNVNVYPGQNAGFELTDGWDVYATGGIVINPWTLAYVGGGYGQRSFHPTGILSTIGIGDTTVDGAIIKAGLEAKLPFIANGAFVRAEYEHFFANQATLWSEGIGDNYRISVTDTPDINSAKLVIGYQFSSGYEALK